MRRLFDFILVATVAVYIIPVAKQTLYPTQMARLEKMLRNSSMSRCRLSVDGNREYEIVLTAYDGGKSITAQIYRDVLRELEPVDGNRIFFSHAINDNSNQVVYLSRVRLETDPDLKELRHLEISVCGRIKDQTGNVKYDGHEPIYECEVPIQKITASAKK